MYSDGVLVELVAGVQVKNMTYLYMLCTYMDNAFICPYAEIINGCAFNCFFLIKDTVNAQSMCSFSTIFMLGDNVM